MELPSRSAYNDELTEWFQTGKADIHYLDQAVLRVLTAKFRMGLFENPFSLSGEELKQEFSVNDHEQKELLRATQESLVLLKNDGTLPLKKEIKKIALIGCHADNPRSFFGGYTHISMVEAVRAIMNSMAGVEDLQKQAEQNETDQNETASNQSSSSDSSSPAAPTDSAASTTSAASIRYVPGTQIQSDETEEFDAILRLLKPDCKSLLAQLRDSLPETEILYAYGYPVAGSDESHFEEALNAIRQADICLLTLGGKYGSGSVSTMGEGVDATNINLPICQQKFLREAAKLGKPLVGIHIDGRPVSDDVADDTLNALLECWSPSEYGAEAITSVLTGAYNPSGKLPVSVARSSGQIPVYYNHPNGSSYHQGESIGFADYVDMPHTPRYFFGYGLSYTSFAYENLELNQREVTPDGAVEISFSVKNTGQSAGTEIVQLYIRDRYARAVRPVQELAGFTRVTLEPGEQKQIVFCLKASQTAFIAEEGRWLIEAGDIDVLVGASCADIRLTDSFRITESKWIDGRDRAFWAENKN